MAGSLDWRAVLPADAPVPPDGYRALCEAFVAGLQDVLGEGLLSVYLYGAVTFPRPEGWALDVDFHTVLAAVPTEAERTGLQGLHARLADDFPPLGRDLDGYHLLLADVRGSQPPASVAGAFPSTGGTLAAGPVDDAWALHRAHVLAGRVAVLHGLDPRGVVAPPRWPEVVEGLGAELAFIREHPEHAAFGVLNACRIAWSVEHRDVVVSKAAAAEWGAARHPAWADALAAARRSYTGRAATGDELLLDRGRRVVLAATEAALASAG